MGDTRSTSPSITAVPTVPVAMTGTADGRGIINPLTLPREAGTNAAERAVGWLCRLQHPSGSWSDFLVAVGFSDAWVTGYVGAALAAAARSPRLLLELRADAAEAADAAADWLLANPGREGGWGYTAAVRPDADSTSWAVRLLAARGRAVPPAALEFLAAHAADGGYRTYHDTARTGRWSEPTPDVTAAALLAQYEAGVLDQTTLADAWRELIAPARSTRDTWTSRWWDEEGYATALVVEAWAAAGRPGPLAPRRATPPGTAFGQALWLYARSLTDRPADAVALLAAQGPDGGWAGDALLLVPHPRGGGINERSIDARGTFTTATVLRGLLVAPSVSTQVAVSHTNRPDRDPAGLAYDQLVADTAADLGVDVAASVQVFRELTAESLAWPAAWPSQQLSGLAGGLPVELSASDAGPALRYSVEIGNPALPPYPRAESALGAIARTAALLGYGQAWTAAGDAVRVLVNPALATPEGCRFWVWAGLDAKAGDFRPTLKVYLAVLDRELPGGRDRLTRALHALGVPEGAPILRAVDRLEQVGFCHEVGIGIGPGGRVGAKLYYDLHGWRPDLVASLLAEAGLRADPTPIRPAIPGVLLESLSEQRRAGIALRVGLAGGTVDELTVVGAFPPPMVGHAEVARRVGAWLDEEGTDRRTYDALVARLLPQWPDRRGVLHSIFTRTRSESGVTNTVYLRPAYPVS